MVELTERQAKYKASVEASSAARRRKINLARKQEADAEREASRLGLRFERREADGRGYLRNVVYCVFRRSWNIGQYCPESGKLTMAGGIKVIDAESLPHAVTLAAKHEGCAPKVAERCEQVIPTAPTKKGKKPKKGHKPKKPSHQAKGKRMTSFAPTLFLTDDDMNLTLAALDSKAEADEASGVDAVSLNRELAERIREALDEDGAKVVYQRKATYHASAMHHWELN